MASSRTRLAGGARPHRRRGGPGCWSRAREERFFEALAESCNVSWSAAEAGVSASSAYRRRMGDAAFRAQWDRSIAVAYAELEMMLLSRALQGVEKEVAVKGEGSRAMRHYDDRTALALLKFHRERADAVDRGVDEQEHAEAVERIIARLRRLKERVEADGGLEFKSLVRHGAVARWALGRGR